MICWRARWQEAEATRKILKLNWFISTKKIYFRALQGHPGRNLIDPSLQDNVFIPNDFEYTCHMCNQFAHHREFRIDTKRIKFEQKKKTDGILQFRGSHTQRIQRSWYNRSGCTAFCTVSADSVEETSKHCVLDRYQTCSKERIKVLSDAIIYEKVYASPRPSPKISLKHDWMKDLGSAVAGHGERVQPTQPKTTNSSVKTVRPVTSEQPSSSLTHEIDKRFLFGCESTNERKRRPVQSCVPVSCERLVKTKTQTKTWTQIN